MNVSRNAGLGVVAGALLSVGLAVDFGDGVSVIVVFGLRVGLDVAVVANTSRSVAESDPVARLPKDADKHKAYNLA